MFHGKLHSFEEACGSIEFKMTNNYMFRYILQTNPIVLKGLICSLLHLNPHEIKSLKIQNPIDLSANATGKEFILDIKILLNSNTLLNLEMQIRNEYNWPERSLIYLCRTFDQLYRGQHYEEAIPVRHIGFVDFSLFPEYPEFYATYKLSNIKNQLVYSDKFILSVVNLNQTELATEEDRFYGIDSWARLFKAKTWEELRMIAIENEYLQEAATSLFIANADEIVRQQCLAREDAERLERTLERDKKRLQADLADLEKKKAILEKNNADLEKSNADLEKSNADLIFDKKALETDNADLRAEVESLKKLVLELQGKLTENK